MVQQHKRNFIDTIYHVDGDSRQWLRILVVLTSVVMTCACSGCSVLRPETGFTDMKAPTAMAFVYKQADTLGQCYHGCLADMGCMSFFYNKISRMCQSHRMVYLSPETLLSDVGSDYYRISCDTCSRDFGYMLNRKLDVCFALIPFSPPYTLDVMNSHCRQAGGGRMMTVDTEQKHVLVREIVRNSFKGKRNVKIGLSRSTINDTWQWATGKTLSWSHWMKGNPTNGTVDLCGFMNAYSNWDWNANDCTVVKYKLAACEI